MSVNPDDPAELQQLDTSGLFDAAWYRKQRPTFADSLAAVRRQIWREQGFLTSRREGKTRKLRPALHDGIACAL